MSGRSEALAASTHWTVSLTERFKFIAGARFSREKKDGSFFNPFYRPQPNDVFKVLGAIALTVMP